MTTTSSYEQDIVCWANEQAELLLSKQFALLDLEHLAEEIIDVGKSEQRELANRMAVLLCHLLKWHYQPARQGSSWQVTIKSQRERINRRLVRTPSLKNCLTDSDWLADAWDDARELAEKETAIPYDKFPEQCPWTMAEIMSTDWLPQ